MSSPASCEMPCLVIVATYKWQVACNSTLISHTYPRPATRHPVDFPAGSPPVGGGRPFGSNIGSAAYAQKHCATSHFADLLVASDAELPKLSLETTVVR